MKGIMLLVGLLLIFSAPSAWAHSFDIGSEQDPVLLGLGDSDSNEHTDAEDYKGWLNIWVQNTGTEAWGDFHFNIYQVPGQDAVDNVHFLDSTMNAYDGGPGYDPTSSQQSITWDWDIDNDVVGATMNLYFYDDPIDPGETAFFSVYTDNTQDNVAIFGTSFYPTPVPVPCAIWLLGSGLIGLIGIRRKK